MTNQHDSAIAYELIRHEHHLPAFRAAALRLLPTVHDDAIYWQLLGTAWIKAGRVLELDRWRPLFEVNRRGRWKLMKKKDRRVWRDLPPVVVAYRATRDGEDLDAVISWTLDRTVAALFAERHGRRVVERRIPRDHIVAYFDRRHEREIVVLVPDAGRAMIGCEGCCYYGAAAADDGTHHNCREAGGIVVTLTTEQYRAGCARYTRDPHYHPGAHLLPPIEIKEESR